MDYVGGVVTVCVTESFIYIPMYLFTFKTSNVYNSLQSSRRIWPCSLGNYFLGLTDTGISWLFVPKTYMFTSGASMSLLQNSPLGTSINNTGVTLCPSRMTNNKSVSPCNRLKSSVTGLYFKRLNQIWKAIQDSQHITHAHLNSYRESINKFSICSW